MKVSKPFRSFILNCPPIWKSVDLQQCPIFTYPYNANEMIFKNIQQVSSNTEIFLEFLVRNELARYVVELDLTRTFLMNAYLPKLFWIADNFPNLEKLSMQEVNLHSWRYQFFIVHQGLNMMEEMYKQTYPKLKVLNINSTNGSDYDTETGMLISKRFPNLEVLLLRGWRTVNYTYVYRAQQQQNFEEEDLHLLNTLPHLRVLDITEPNTVYPLSIIKILLQSLPNLKVLCANCQHEEVANYVKEKGLEV